MLLRRLGDQSFWNSIQEFDQIRNRLNQLLETDMSTAGNTGLSTYPPLNTWLSEDGAIVTAEIPGLTSDSIELSVVNDTLTIKGERPTEQSEEGQQCHRKERGTGSFSRTVQLPFAVESEAVEASFRKGVLEIRLPRAASEKPKKIAIKSN